MKVGGESTLRGQQSLISFSVSDSISKATQHAPFKLSNAYIIIFYWTEDACPTDGQVYPAHLFVHTRRPCRPQLCHMRTASSSARREAQQSRYTRPRLPSIRGKCPLPLSPLPHHSMSLANFCWIFTFLTWCDNLLTWIDVKISHLKISRGLLIDKPY